MRNSIREVREYEAGRYGLGGMDYLTVGGGTLAVSPVVGRQLSSCVCVCVQP